MLEKNTFGKNLKCNENISYFRTKGEAGTGDVVQAVKHARTIKREIDAAKVK